MNKAIKQAEHALSEHDQRDALRMVEAAATLAAIPSMASPAARELASTRLRALIANHQSSGDLLAAIVRHIESYP